MKSFFILFVISLIVFIDNSGATKLTLENSTSNYALYHLGKSVFIGKIDKVETVKIDGTEYDQVTVDIRKKYKGSITNPFTFPVWKTVHAQLGKEYFWHVHKTGELELTDTGPLLMSDVVANTIERLYDYASKGKDEDEIRQRFVEYSKKIIRDEKKECEKLHNFNDRESCINDTKFWI